VAGTSGAQFGAADVLQSTMLTPRRARGAAWGAGAVAELPTGTDARLSTRKWSLGPTGALVLRRGAFVAGAAASHLWSVAGNADRADVSRTTAQPFVSWTNRSALTVGTSLEGAYDWTADTWRPALNLGASQVVSVNARSASVGVFARTYGGGGANVPRWGVRFVVTLVFPRVQS
jgi:hypothetical protein